MERTQELLDKVIKAHGGIKRWQSVSEITARVKIGGLLPISKFVSSELRRIEIKVSTNKPYTTISPFPSMGYKGVFDNYKVYIKSDDGEIVNERLNPRSFFKSFRQIYGGII